LSKYRKSSQPSFPKQKAKNAEKEAAKLGHKLGKWKQCNGRWCSKCQNKGCTAEATINRDGYSRLNTNKRRCPIGVHSV